MVKAGNIAKEINALRKEIDELKAEYQRAGRKTAKSASRSADHIGALKDGLMEEAAGLRDSISEGVSGATDDLIEQLDELKETLRGYSDQAEKAVGAHPLATVAGAMAIGYLIGRFSR